LIFTGILCVAIGIAAHWMRTLFRQFQVAAGLGWYQSAPAIPTGWRALDDRSPRKVVGLIIVRPDERSMAEAVNLPSLRTLILTHPSRGEMRFYPPSSHDSGPWQRWNRAFLLDDPDTIAVSLKNDHLAALKCFADLRVLQLDGQPIDDECITHLAALQSLERMYLRKTRISAGGDRETACRVT